MKKLVLIILILFLSLFTNFTDEPVTRAEIIINEEHVGTEYPVKYEEDNFLVPVELIFNKLNYDTEWQEQTETLSGFLGGFRVDFPLNSTEITADDKTFSLDVPVKIIDEKIYAPVRPSVEAVGAFVEWVEETREIKISTPQEFDPALKDDQKGPLLHVAYPPARQHSYYEDSIFIYGTTQSYSQIEVTVNGEPVDLMDKRTGNFLTMADIPGSEEFPIIVEASDGENTTTIERSVVTPAGRQAMPEEPLEIHSTHLLPAQDQVLNPGDTLRIVARGSPGATAYYQIGEDNLVQMTELSYSGGPVGRGGIYTTTYRVKEDDAPGSGISEYRPLTVTLIKDGEQVSRELPGKVAFFSDTPYNVVEVRDQSELKYSGWLQLIDDSYYLLYSDTRGGTGYPTSVFTYMIEGTRFETVGISGNYYRTNFRGNDTFLLHKDVVDELEDKDSLEPVLSGIELSETDQKVSLRLDAAERFPFRTDSSKNQLRVILYEVAEDEDLSIPEMPDSVLDLTIEPRAWASDVLVLNIELDLHFTGYTPSWEGTDLVINFDKPPLVDKDNPLDGRTIVVDPGHGGDDRGAAGPGDIHEKDVVLKMSLYLRDLLVEDGAEVIMTRTEDIDLDLYARPEAKYIDDTDFFISVHANAHAQGANAVDLHGIMILYNYDHNEKLANIMLDTVSEEMNLPAMSTWRRNIAVTRLPQFPSVLVEAGYMMHPEDNWHIFHPRGQKKFAGAMKEGIRKYFLSFEDNQSK